MTLVPLSLPVVPASWLPSPSPLFLRHLQDCNNEDLRSFIHKTFTSGKLKTLLHHLRQFNLPPVKPLLLSPPSKNNPLQL